jgi:hypothetical protein
MSMNSKTGGGSRASDEDTRTAVKVGECARRKSKQKQFGDMMMMDAVWMIPDSGTVASRHGLVYRADHSYSQRFASARR